MNNLTKPRWYLSARHLREHAAWLINRRGKSASHLYKQKIIRQFAEKYDLKNFVESGTYLGEMVYAMRYRFDNLYSIELSHELCLKAKADFQKFPRVKIYEGNSSQMLPMVVAELKGPSLFWLDGHYSGGFTAKGDLQTPIVKELRAIIGHAPERSVILVDDARSFTGAGDYPSLAEISQLVKSLDPRLRLEVENDIIRIF